MQPIVGSGLPKVQRVITKDARQPEAAARSEVVAMTATAGSKALRVRPRFRPIQPTARTIDPTTTIGTLWQAIGLAVPSAFALPIRGPTASEPANARTPPVRWITPDPAKSTTPAPSPSVAPRSLNQPPPQTQPP